MTLNFAGDSGEVLVNSQTHLGQYAPSVAALTGGGFVVSWHSYDGWDDTDDAGIKAQIFDADGLPVGAEFLVNTRTGSVQEMPEVAALSGGGFAITWQSFDRVDDFSGYAVKAQVFGADGTAVGTEILVNTATAGGQYSPDIAGQAGGGFVVAWRSDTGDGSASAILAQRFDETGAPVGSEFVVNSDIYLFQTDPAVTALGSGGFVVTWQSQDGDGSGWSVKAQIFDANGDAVGGEKLINTAGDLHQQNPAVTELEDGALVFVWDSSDGDQDIWDTGIKAQILAADGTPRGTEFLVNTETFGAQSDPSVTAVAGGFLVTWHSEDEAPDSSGIKGQLFDLDGTALGDEFLVNTRTTGTQTRPDAAALANGDVVLTWQSGDGQDDGSSYSVKAKLFDTEDNFAPVALDGAVQTDEDTRLAASIAEDVEDPDGDVWTATVESDVTQGVLQFQPDGTYTYDPDENFNGTDSFTYSVRDGDGASDTATVVITVAAIEDPLEISGTTSGALVEDETHQATGALSARDSDPEDSPAFVAQNGFAGAFGSFWIAAGGAWRYELDPVASQALAGGGTFVERFTVTARTDDGESLTETVEITLHGREDPVVIAGDTSGSVTEDAPGAASGVLQATDDDADDLPVFLAQPGTSGQFGSFELLATGAWSYALDARAQALGGGEAVTEVFTISARTDDGETRQADVSILVTGTEDTPTIAGTTTGEVTEDSSETASGTATAQDADLGDAPAFEVQTAILGDFGRFSIDDTGAWVYVLEPDTVSSLDGGDVALDRFVLSAATADGEFVQTQVTITVHGANEPRSDTTSDPSGGAEVPTDTAASAANTAPSGADRVLSLLEGEEHRFAAEDFGFSDPDGDRLSAVVIAALPTSGSLTRAGGTVAPGDVIAVADIPSLLWAPDPGLFGSGVASLSFQVRDDSGEADDTDPDPDTLTFDVAQVLFSVDGIGVTIVGNDAANVIVASDGDDVIRPGRGADQIALGAGADVIQGSLAELDGDRVEAFSAGDLVQIEDLRARLETTATDPGETRLGFIDVPGGSATSEMWFSGDFTSGAFMAVWDGRDTWVTFEPFLPRLTDKVALADSAVNGITNARFLTGTGDVDFKITLQDLGFAAKDNCLGVYEMTRAGALVDARILFADANADKSASTTITGVESGHRLGFFLVQDGADWATSLTASGGLSFQDAEGGLAQLSDAADVALALDGSTVDALVFHSLSDELNPDGLTRVVSGVEPGGDALLVGFEDMTHGGDRDFEDVVFKVELIDLL